MKERKKLDDIRLDTVPNGYDLRFKGQSYFYFTKEALLEGFMTHVGLEELESMDAETMRDFITAAIVWKEEGSAIKQVLKLKDEVETLQRQLEVSRQRIKQLTKKNREDAKKKKSDEEDDEFDDDVVVSEPDPLKEWMEP